MVLLLKYILGDHLLYFISYWLVCNIKVCSDNCLIVDIYFPDSYLDFDPASPRALERMDRKE